MSWGVWQLKVNFRLANIDDVRLVHVHEVCPENPSRSPSQWPTLWQSQHQRLGHLHQKAWCYDGVIFSYWNILILNTFSRLYRVVFFAGEISPKNRTFFLESTSTSPIAWDTWETLPSSQWHRIHPNLKILLVFFFFRGDFQFLWGEIWRSRGGARSSASRQCQHGFGFGQGVVWKRVQEARIKENQSWWEGIWEESIEVLNMKRWNSWCKS